MEYGRYVIFYNERMDNIVYPREYEATNVYTELCEVVIQGKQNPGAFILKPTYVTISLPETRVQKENSIIDYILFSLFFGVVIFGHL